MINEKLSLTPQWITVTGFDSTKIDSVLLYKIGGIRFMRVVFKAGAINLHWTTNISIPLNTADCPAAYTVCQFHKAGQADENMIVSGYISSNGTFNILSNKASTTTLYCSVTYVAQGA